MALVNFSRTLLLHGSLTLLECLLFRRGKSSFLVNSKGALLDVFPVAPPKRGRGVKMGDIRAVLLVRLGLSGAAVQIPVRNDLWRHQSFVVQDLLKGLQNVTHRRPRFADYSRSQ